jgi:hypothetical protein
MEFHGNIVYGYSDAAAMFLSGAGIRGVSAGLVEVLAGLAAAGAARLAGPGGDRIVFGVAPSAVPDRLSQALDLLGCEYTVASGAAGADPAGLLRDALAAGPALLGPLDQAHLSYIPKDHQHAAGTEHYLLAYAVDGDLVHLRDPIGFPAATLPVAELTAAWRAERLGFGCGPYHRWSRVRRAAEPDPAGLAHRVAERFRAWCRDTPAADGVVRRYAADLRAGKVDEAGQAYLVNFTFPIETRRRLDYAWFFRHAGQSGLADRYQRQADLLGAALQAANFGRWDEVADRLTGYAGLMAPVPEG